MAETLVIRLRAAPEAPASWLIVDANGARSGPARSGAVANALPLANGRRVLLLLPGSEITLAEPELPLRGGARVAQAVPFALEEHLASDVDALHFAIGNRAEGVIGTPVAAVARGLMDRWSDAWNAAGLAPQAAYADSAVVPVLPGSCTLLLDENALYVRRSNATPFVLDAEPLATALDIAVAPTHDNDDASREHVTFFVSPGEYEVNRELIEGLRERTASLQVKLMTEGALPVLAAQAVDASAVNLLQGAYVPRKSASAGLQRWRLPAALAAACLLAFVAVQTLSLWKLSRAEKRLDAQIAEVFQQALPGQPVVDPRAQMQGVLGGAGSAQGALLPALSVLAQAMADGSGGGKLEAINLRGDALDLRLVAPTVEALDGIKQAMARNGIDAELTSATPRGNQVEGQLQLKFGPA
jgi:general secretion pathway protein L